jgi:C-terminal processing protease CtpA/Prc
MNTALVLSLLVSIVSMTCHATTVEFRESDRSHAYTMLRDVQKQIEEKYFDPSYKGVDLGANAEVAKARISKATSIGETLAAIAQFVLELDDSHTFFVPPWQTATVDYGWDMGIVGDTCYVLGVKPSGDAARQGVKRGDIVKAVNGLIRSRFPMAPRISLPRAAPQPDFSELIPATVRLASSIWHRMCQRKKSRSTNRRGSGWTLPASLTTRTSKHANDNPRLRNWQAGSGRTLRPCRGRHGDRAVVGRARGHEVPILDLRGTRRPVAAMQALLGGLSSSDVIIGSSKERDHATPLVAKGTGNEAFSGRVFVLIDAASASASELVARTVQLTNRGTVIGDRSAGAVMTSRYYPLMVSHGENVISYGVMVTAADPIMSDGGRLEKKGVNPDFKILPTAEDLAAGHDPALAQALKFAGQPLDAQAAGALLPKH